MNKESVHNISVSLIKSGIEPPGMFESEHVKECRVLIDLFNQDPNKPEIKIKIKDILTTMNLKPSEADILAVMAEVKKLYIDDYM